MADRPKPDPDELFSLHPLEGEDVLKALLGEDDDIEDPAEGEDS
jgi:hypothetical protein